MEALPPEVDVPGAGEVAPAPFADPWTQPTRPPRDSRVPPVLLAGGTLGLVLLAFLTSTITWRSDAQFHVIIETTAALLAAFTGILALIRYRGGRTPAALFVGVGFLGTAFLDAYHAVVSSTYFAAWFPSSQTSLLPWSWLASRFFLSLFFAASVLVWHRESSRTTGRDRPPTRSWEFYIVVGGAALSAITFALFAWLPMPEGHQNWILSRPQETVPGLLFLVALAGQWRWGLGPKGPLALWLTWSLTVAVAIQFFFMPFSSQLFDAFFDAGHGLKLFSYGLVCFGLVVDTVRVFEREQQHITEIARSRSELEAYGQRLEEIVAERTADLRASEAKFRRLAEADVLGIIFWDVSGSITWANDAFLHMMGFTRDDLEEGRLDWQAMTPPEYEPRDAQALVELAERGVCTPFEKEYIRADGTRVPIQLGVATFEGGTTGVAYVLDLTEQKRADRELRASLDELERVSRRLRLATESAGIGVWEFDLESEVLHWDDIMCRLYGVRPKDFGHSYADWERAVHPEDRAPAAAAVQHALEEESSFHSEFRVVWPSGEVRTIVGHATVIRNDDGSPLRMVGVNWDVTAERAASAELERLNEELESRVAARTQALQRANEELESFAYTVSHDLRAPLRQVDGFSKILTEEHKDQLSEDGARLLTMARESAVRMGQLIDELLEFSRLGRQRLSTRPVDLRTVVDEALANLQTTIDETGAQVKIHDLPSVSADPTLVRLVYQNLLENALKFSSHRSPPTVEVGMRTIEGEDVCFVRDNGVGFDMRHAGKLFGVFQRLHRTDEYPGTGVGLATVQRIVHRHGGRIWADAEPDRGATFFFTLPGVAP